MTFLERVCDALQRAGVRYAVVGGHAVALHGAVRGTLDIDIALNWSRKALRDAEQALEGLGLESRLPVSADEVFEFREEFMKKRNLVAWNFHNPRDLAEHVDIVLPYDLKGRKTKRITVGNTEVRVLSLDDLIAMKKDSGRAQDTADAEALEKLQ
jgi:hypothetical protein